MRIRNRFIRPARWASTGCPLSRTTRKNALGSASVTSPSKEIASSFTFCTCTPSCRSWCVWKRTPDCGRRAPAGGVGGPALERLDRGRLRALGALLRLEAHPLTLLQVPVARTLDLGEVAEQVLAPVVGRDEAVALLGGEPLDDAFRHVHPSFARRDQHEPPAQDRPTSSHTDPAPPLRN